MKPYGIRRSDKELECSVKGCNCSEYHSKFPNYIMHKNKIKTRKKHARQQNKKECYQ
jgi:hypothetical protein